MEGAHLTTSSNNPDDWAIVVLVSGDPVVAAS
jgi:hypothetical protein